MIRQLVGEGRTVFLSSHLLDEVEKACDSAAIIDGGRIVTQGTIAELARGDRIELVVSCSDPDRALAMLREHALVTGAQRSDDGLRLALASTGAAAELNRALVQAGIDVSRLEPVRSTLEQRFLEITSRLETQA